MKMFDAFTDLRSCGQRLLAAALLSMFAYWYLFIFEQSVLPVTKAFSSALFGEDRAAYVRIVPRFGLMLLFAAIAWWLYRTRPARPAVGANLIDWFDYAACSFIPLALAASAYEVLVLYDWAPGESVIMVARRFTTDIALPLEIRHELLPCGWQGTYDPHAIRWPFQYMANHCSASHNLTAVLPYAALYAVWRRTRGNVQPRPALPGGSLSGKSRIDRDDGRDTRALPRR